MFDCPAPHFKKSPLPLDVVPCSDTEDSVWGALSLSEGFPGTSAGKESACNAGDPSLIPGSTRSPGEGLGYPLHYSWAAFMAQIVNNPPVGHLGLIPGSGRSPGGGHGNPFQYFCLENPHGQRSLMGYSP